MLHALKICANVSFFLVVCTFQHETNSYKTKTPVFHHPYERHCPIPIPISARSWL